MIPCDIGVDLTPKGAKSASVVPQAKDAQAVAASDLKKAFGK
ncbi:hypothetical protein [Chitinophaga rhizophila]|nr:hypothetical protein [Chitinophaga rhizophila]